MLAYSILINQLNLHEWGDPFVTPNGYFSSSTTVDEAVYHTLTRHTSDKLQKLLGSSRRKNVLKGIELMSPSIVFFPVAWLWWF